MIGYHLLSDHFISDYSTQQLSALDRDRLMNSGGGGDLDYGGGGGGGPGAKSATSSSSSSQQQQKQSSVVVSSPSNSDHSRDAHFSLPRHNRIMLPCLLYNKLYVTVNLISTFICAETDN